MHICTVCCGDTEETVFQKSPRLHRGGNILSRSILIDIGRRRFEGNASKHRVFQIKEQEPLERN